MDLHQLRQFVAVAEELHFGKAAARLNIVQPALTQTVKRLEAHFDVRLFERGTRSARLTPAGAVLLKEARSLLGQAAFAQARVRQAAAGEIGEINVGYVEAALFKVIPPAMRRFVRERPQVTVKLAPHTTDEQLALIAEGALDCGLIQFLHPVDTPLAVRTVGQVDIRLAVPSGWDIAREDRVRMAALRGLPFIMFRQEVAPDFHANVTRLCERHGFRPNVRHEARGLYTFLNLVASGIGIAFLPCDIGPNAVDGVKWLSIEDVPERELRLEIGFAHAGGELPAQVGFLSELLPAPAVQAS